jgi:hypothetical protein
MKITPRTWVASLLLVTAVIAAAAGSVRAAELRGLTLRAGIAHGAPGAIVQISMRITPRGARPVGVQVDLLYDPSVVTLVDPQGCALRDGLTTHSARTASLSDPPPGLAGVRVVVLPKDLAAVPLPRIPRPATLFTCGFRVASSAASGRFPIVATGLVATDPEGHRPQRLVARNGQVAVRGGRSGVTPALAAQATAGSATGQPLAAATSCVGDCDASGSVTVDEVVRGVNIALGTATVSICPAADSDGDGQVLVNEIVKAVNNALTGCPVIAPTQLLLTTARGTGVCGVTRDNASGGGTILKNLSCGGLSIGGGNVQTPVPEGPTPDGGTNVYAITSCTGSVCTLGPVTTPPAANSADRDCTTTGCNFGTPLPIANGLTSTCVVNTYHESSSGTADLSNGEMNLSVNLDAHTFLTGEIRDAGGTPRPCPVCVAGTCSTGPNHGKACASTNPSGLSRDCPPGGTTCVDGPNGGKFCSDSNQCPESSCGSAFDFGRPGLNVNLTPFKTAKVTKSDPNGAFCPSQNSHRGCFAKPATSTDPQMCRYIEENGSPAGALGVGTAAKPVTLGAVFCIPRTGNALIDDIAAGLPGPGAVTVVYTTQVLP